MGKCPIYLTDITEKVVLRNH